MDRGIDFVEQSQRRLEDMVSYLGKHNLANTDGVFIAGISRGGFLAAQYAARAAPTRVAAVGLLSPVTNLSLLSEFADENATMQVGHSQLYHIARGCIKQLKHQDHRLLKQRVCPGLAPGNSSQYRCHQTGSVLGNEECFCYNRRRRPTCVHGQLRTYSTCDSVPWLQRNWSIFSTVGTLINAQIAVQSGTFKSEKFPNEEILSIDLSVVLILSLIGAIVGTAAAAAHPHMAIHSFASTESRTDTRCRLTQIQRPLSLSSQHGCYGSLVMT
eukprot:COSAG02_NODE_7727_length_2873_cov_6.172275_2_plen_271_part_00